MQCSSNPSSHDARLASPQAPPPQVPRRDKLLQKDKVLDPEPRRPQGSSLKTLERSVPKKTRCRLTPKSVDLSPISVSCFLWPLTKVALNPSRQVQNFKYGDAHSSEILQSWNLSAGIPPRRRNSKFIWYLGKCPLMSPGLIPTQWEHVV